MKLKIFQVPNAQLQEIVNNVWDDYQKETKTNKMICGNKTKHAVASKYNDVDGIFSDFYPEETNPKSTNDKIDIRYILFEKETNVSPLVNMVQKTFMKENNVSTRRLSPRMILFLKVPTRDYTYIVASGPYQWYVKQSINKFFGVQLFNVILNKSKTVNKWNVKRVGTKDIGATRIATRDNTYTEQNLVRSLESLDFFELLKTTAAQLEIGNNQLTMEGGKIVDFFNLHRTKQGNYKIVTDCSSYFETTMKMEDMDSIFDYILLIDSLWFANKDNLEIISKPLYSFLSKSTKVSSKEISNFIIDKVKNSADGWEQNGLYIFPQSIETYHKMETTEIFGKTVAESKTALPLEFQKIINFYKTEKKALTQNSEITFKDNDDIIEKGKILSFLHGTISYQGEEYFLFEGQVFEFDKNYLDKVHQNIANKINSDSKNHPDLINLLDSVEYKGENKYLEKQKWEKPNVWVGHPNKINSKSFELFDLCYENEGKYYLIYAKTVSAGSGIRDLSVQVKETIDYIHTNIEEVNSELGKLEPSIVLRHDNIIPVVLFANKGYSNQGDRGYLSINKDGSYSQNRSFYLDLSLHSLERLNHYGNEILFVPMKNS